MLLRSVYSWGIYYLDWMPTVVWMWHLGSYVIHWVNFEVNTSMEVMETMKRQRQARRELQKKSKREWQRSARKAMRSIT